ncbi:BCCT family transporter [Amaricoccus sp. W119]|uniref:BCCT family transporter n=1 Tax=Amaricoccus sp. W119 TaxID=3391833 RepID=UPI0039A5E6C4
MALRPPMTDLPIAIHDAGFYDGFNRTVAIGSKVLVGVLILWAAVFPEQAAEVLAGINSGLMANFGTWYIYATAFFVLICLGLALWPASGRIRLGQPDEKPEFSSFSWFSMMFGAGIGIGMMTYSTAEPIYHFSTNPDVIKGTVAGASVETVRSAYKWSFLHWGLTPWGAYALVGLSLAFFSYSRGLPLTIRSGLAPLFGDALRGPLGHVIDIVAVVATVLGVAVTIGFGVSQFASGLYAITGAEWMMVDGAPTNGIMVVCLVIVMAASTLSAASGVGKGIKWLSNINMGLSFFLLAFFIIFGATLFSFRAFFVGLFDYLVALPSMMFTVWHDDGTETGKALAEWQSAWTVFYWAWWIAFAPFVGLFLARISRGRTIREFIFGAMLVPSLMCFAWFAIVGGTAIDLELSGVAQGSIINAGLSSQLFAMLGVMLSPAFFMAMNAIIVLLLLTYLVTSADSAILIINTINSGGDASQKGNQHILIWGAGLTVVIATLLYAGGLQALQTAMIIGALPFSAIMALSAIALVKAIIRDGIRAREQAAAA